MMGLIEDTWKLNRTLVSDGYDEALENVCEYVEPDVTVHEIPSGTRAWTWEVPQKWSLEGASISDGNETLLEYDHPLRVVTYSNPVDRWVSHDELMDHLYWDQPREHVFNGDRLPAHPDAIPYVFKFYDDDWGFCVRETELDRFSTDEYHVEIDATFEPGTLKVGECSATGQSDDRIMLMAHLDHPAQVNDDLAGVAVGAEVINRLAERNTRYTYTLLVVPETIGSIAYFSQNEHRIDEFAFGIYLEMLGTDGSFSLQHSFEHDTPIDRVAERVLERSTDPFESGPYRTVIRNDEVVTNGPGVRIPTISLSRWPYPEKHTSLDTPEIVSTEHLEESVETVLSIVDMLEENHRPVRKFTGPIFLSGYDLWDEWGGPGHVKEEYEYMIQYLEGDHTILDIADELDFSFEKVHDFVTDLADRDLAVLDEPPHRADTTEHGPDSP